MLRKIFIDNYKSFDNFEMETAGVTLLLGKNGTGKSSLLKALAAIRDFSVFGISEDKDEDGNPVPRFGAATLTRWNAKDVQTFELHVDVDGVPYLYRLKFDMWGNPSKTRTLLEEVVCDGVSVFRFAEGVVHLFDDRTGEEKVQYPFDWCKSALATVYPRAENEKVTAFKRWLENVIKVQIDPWAMGGKTHAETQLLEEDAGNFASWYRHLRQNADIAAVSAYVGDLQKMIPELGDVVVCGENGADRALAIRPKKSESVEKRGYAFQLSDLSDGQRALMVLYAILHFKVVRDTLICLDEPDNFLALDEVQPYLRALTEKAEDAGAQLVVVSHHPETVNYLAESNGVELTREDGFQTRVKPFKNDYEKLTPADVVARGWN